MNALFLILIVVGLSVQQVTKKAYNQRISGGAFSFSAASSLFALLFFAVTVTEKLDFNSEFLIYSVLFALCYSVATFCSFMSILTGPLSISSLVIQYSLIIPTVYGLIAFKEPISVFLIIGIVLLLISLFLVNLENKSEEKKINLKWGIYTFFAFVANGGCSTVQKVQQENCNGNYKNEFMIIALAITVIVLGIISIISEKREIAFNLKKGFIWYSVCGIANGLVNFLVLVLSLKMEASIMFPIISAGGILLTALISIFLYKEKLSIQQKIGLALGTLAIVALNI